jgi:NIPSNAP
MKPVYEMRTYHAGPGKMNALLSRFALHTDALLERYHMKPVSYWTPRENPENLLIYIIEHESVEAAERNWEEFHNDPEWQRIKAETDASGPLAATIERYFMDKVDLSKFTSEPRA